MKTCVIVVLLLFIWVIPGVSQDMIDVDSGSTAGMDLFPVQLPPELRNWTPKKEQFQLYINFDGKPENSDLPRIDIMSDNVSWPFRMSKIGDTIRILIIPPGYKLKDAIKIRDTVRGLDKEFPFVVLAGAERAVYWFSNDSGKVTIDEIQPASFIATIPLRELPDDVLTLQLQRTNDNAKKIRELEKELGDLASLVQLDDGFYQNIWLRVSKIRIQRWKTNETQIGTYLAWKCVPESLDVVAQILEKYKREYVATK